MKINGPRRRKAISPVLATVILIAITLIAAIAIAGFVFGLFGTFTGGQNISLAGSACAHTSGAILLGQATTHVNSCVLELTNTGGSAASVTGCTVYGATGTVSGLSPVVAAPGPVPVPAGTTTANAVYAQCWAGLLTSGAAVTGQLVVASGSPLSFSAIAGG
jgi:flagellin-like protein